MGGWLVGGWWWVVGWWVLGRSRRSGSRPGSKQCFGSGSGSATLLKTMRKKRKNVKQKNQIFLKQKEAKNVAKIFEAERSGKFEATRSEFVCLLVLRKKQKLSETRCCFIIFAPAPFPAGSSGSGLKSGSLSAPAPVSGCRPKKFLWHTQFIVLSD